MSDLHLVTFPCYVLMIFCVKTLIKAHERNCNFFFLGFFKCCTTLLYHLHWCGCLQDVYPVVYLHSWCRLSSMLAQLCDLCPGREEKFDPFPQASCCFHRDSVLHAQGEWNTSTAPVSPVLSRSGYPSLSALSTTDHLLQHRPLTRSH